ncbi:MAG: HD family phosphohydrolase [Clostridia bacterium]|nr:HD family phosphohydrolase [Clostridia bacterium]
MKNIVDLNKEIVDTLNNIDLDDNSDDLLNNYIKSNNNSKEATELVEEFNEIIADIANNPNVLALKNHAQHYSTTRYAHCKEVSFLTYLICKKLKLDYISAARGAMLHDFYFYNWRNKNVEGQKRFHAFRHPRISLANASELFKLNDMEKDIILKHMWPLTVIPPKYTEGLIVTLVDKYSATKGFFGGLRYLRKTNLLSEKNQTINERK